MNLKINELTFIYSYILFFVFHCMFALCKPQTTNAHQFPLSAAGLIPHLGQPNDAALTDQPQTQAKPSAPASSSQETHAAFAAQGTTTMSSSAGDDSIGIVSSDSDSAMQPLPGITFQTPTVDSSKSLPGSITNAPVADMNEVCHSTQYPDVCISSIAPLLPGIKPTVTSILQMAIKACEAETKIAIAFAKKISSSSSITHTSNGGLLITCEENYSDMLDNLKSASDAIRTGDAGTINTMLSAAISDLSTCEDGFVGHHPSPMAHFFDRIQKMASNCLAISKLVK